MTLVGISRRLPERKADEVQLHRERAIVLAICRTLLCELGGTFSVESQPRSPPPSRTTDARGRVLVVDAEGAIRSLLRDLLVAEHEVVAAASAREAQELLLRDSAFDAILCDPMMSEMSGIELHAWLAARDPALASKVLFRSAGAVKPSASENLFGVASHPLEKPLDRETVRQRVRELVARARS